MSSCKLPAFSRHIFTRIFSTLFGKHSNYQTSGTPVRCAPICYMHDREADMAKLTDAFRNFANAPKYNGSFTNGNSIYHDILQFFFFLLLFRCLDAQHLRGVPSFFFLFSTEGHAVKHPHNSEVCHPRCV